MRRETKNHEKEKSPSDPRKGTHGAEYRYGSVTVEARAPECLIAADGPLQPECPG
jgi:hypothetical protein